MNRLSLEKRERVAAALVEGNSIRSTERLTGVHRDTIMRLMVSLGAAASHHMNQEFTDLACKRVQVDEIWCYVGKKQRRLTDDDDPNRKGDFWTFVAIDADTKLVPAYVVGKRDRETTRAFIQDLSLRVPGRLQISSDAMPYYAKAIRLYFGGRADYGQLVKSYVAEPIGPGRYSPPRVKSTTRNPVMGDPRREDISTSYVEAQNLTMRMAMRRFTRLTNGFSRKVENLRAAVSLHFWNYNYARIHTKLAMTPVMAGEVDQRLWTLRDLVELADAENA